MAQIYKNNAQLESTGCGLAFVKVSVKLWVCAPRRAGQRGGGVPAGPQAVRPPGGTPRTTPRSQAPSPPGLRPARRQGAPQAAQRSARRPRASARASGRGRPFRGHGPLLVDQRPPGDQRDPGDPAARSAHLRRRGEGEGCLRDGARSGGPAGPPRPGPGSPPRGARGAAGTVDEWPGAGASGPGSGVVTAGRTAPGRTNRPGPLTRGASVTGCGRCAWGLPHRAGGNALQGFPRSASGSHRDAFLKALPPRPLFPGMTLERSLGRLFGKVMW